MLARKCSARLKRRLLKTILHHRRTSRDFGCTDIGSDRNKRKVAPQGTNLCQWPRTWAATLNSVLGLPWDSNWNMEMMCVWRGRNKAWVALSPIDCYIPSSLSLGRWSSFSSLFLFYRGANRLRERKPWARSLPWSRDSNPGHLFPSPVLAHQIT